MKKSGRSRRRRKEKWGTRMTMIGITFVVFSLAITVTIRGSSLKAKALEYQLRDENLTIQVKKEEERSKDLEQYRIYVQTKQYIEDMAKQKLGLVNPDEILLKPKEKR